MAKNLGTKSRHSLPSATSSGTPTKKLGVENRSTSQELRKRSTGNNALNSRFFLMSTISLDVNNPRELLITPALVSEAPQFDFTLGQSDSSQDESATEKLSSL